MILVISTRNLHKVEEIRTILGSAFRFFTLRDFESVPSIVEDAETFAGNAARKSEGVAKWLGENRAIWTERAGDNPGKAFVLGDDSGLQVDVLNGAPGIYSARFAALDTGAPGNSTDADNNAKLMRLLAGVPSEKRTARFTCALALTEIGKAGSETRTFEGVCEGRIDLQANGSGGFGYDPLFIPNGFPRSFADLGEDVKNQISHRSKALARLKAFLTGPP